MLRKLFLFCTTLAAAAAGVFLWKKRDELEAEVERIRGERRAGLRSAPSPRHGAPAVNGSGRSLDGASQADAGPERLTPERQTPAPRRGPGRVTPGDTGAASPPEDAADALDPGEPEPRVAPLGADAGPEAAGGEGGGEGDQEGSEARCQAHTRSGKRCTRPPEPGSDYCWQHAPS